MRAIGPLAISAAVRATMIPRTRAEAVATLPPERLSVAMAAALEAVRRSTVMSLAKHTKGRAQEMLDRPSILDLAHRGLSEMEPADGAARCRVLLTRPETVHNRRNIRAAMLALRVRRAREARELRRIGEAA